MKWQRVTDFSPLSVMITWDRSFVGSHKLHASPLLGIEAITIKAGVSLPKLASVGGIMFVKKDRFTRSQVNQRILAGCKFYELPHMNDWGQAGTHEALDEAPIAEPANESKIFQELIDTVDVVMDAFRAFSISFNLCSCPSTYLSVTGPALVPDTSREISESKTKKQTVYMGRISSYEWSLVVSAAAGAMVFYLLPTSRLLHLTRCENAIAPLIKLKAVLKGKELLWEADGVLLHFDELGAVYQQAFNAFVSRLRNEQDEVADTRSFLKEEMRLLACSQTVSSDGLLVELTSNAPSLNDAQKDDLQKCILPNMQIDDRKICPAKSRIREKAEKCTLSWDEIVGFVDRLKSAAEGAAALEPSSKNLADSGLESSAELVSESSAEPVTESSAEPVSEPFAELVTELVSEPDLVVAAARHCQYKELIEQSLVELIAEKILAVAELTKNGTSSFEQHLFENALTCLNRVVAEKQMLEGLKALRSELETCAAAEIFLGKWMSHDRSYCCVDKTLQLCKPDSRFLLSTGILLEALANLGEESMQLGEIERTQEANEHFSRMLEFARRAEILLSFC